MKAYLLPEYTDLSWPNRHHLSASRKPILWNIQAPTARRSSWLWVAIFSVFIYFCIFAHTHTPYSIRLPRSQYGGFLEGQPGLPEVSCAVSWAASRCFWVGRGNINFSTASFILPVQQPDNLFSIYRFLPINFARTSKYLRYSAAIFFRGGTFR